MVLVSHSLSRSSWIGESVLQHPALDPAEGIPDDSQAVTQCRVGSGVACAQLGVFSTAAGPFPLFCHVKRMSREAMGLAAVLQQSEMCC